MRFFEDMSLIFEDWGMGPMVGRTWAALLVTGEAHLSAQDLQEQIGASAGSISTALSTLARMGMIDRVWIPGDRRSYYVASIHAFDRLLERRAEALTAMVGIAKSGLDAFDDVPPARERLEHMHDLYTWFDREYDVLLERWRAERREAEERKKKT
ncbi:MAG: MarR family transcriptional regulator [Actinomycetota bacterium]